MTLIIEPGQKLEKMYEVEGQVDGSPTTLRAIISGMPVILKYGYPDHVIDGFPISDEDKEDLRVATVLSTNETLRQNGLANARSAGITLDHVLLATNKHPTMHVVVKANGVEKKVPAQNVLVFPYDRAAKDLGVCIDDQDLHGHTVGQIIEGICRPAEQLHAAGLAHCDYNPPNLLISQFIRAIDVACATTAGQRQNIREGEVFGRTQYAAPEVLLGLVPDERSDVYSIGVMLYEMLTTQTPFTGSREDFDMAVGRDHHLRKRYERERKKAKVDGKSLHQDLVTSYEHAIGKRPEFYPGQSWSKWFAPRQQIRIYDVAMQAMSIKPQDRYQTVADLRKAAITALS